MERRAMAGEQLGRMTRLQTRREEIQRLLPRPPVARGAAAGALLAEIRGQRDPRPPPVARGQRDPLRRLLLPACVCLCPLTEGQANGKVPAELAVRATGAEEERELGVGHDGKAVVDQVLRSSWAEPPVEDAFAKCLGGLVSVVMQEVHLELAFATGEITAVYSCGPGQPAVAVSGGGGAGVSVRLGEMYAEEERELLVEVRAPLGSHPHSLSVRCSYRDPALQETVRGAEQPLLLPPLQGECASSRRLHDLFVATRAVAESRRLAELQSCLLHVR